MSVPCPVSMFLGGGGKTATTFVMAVLVVWAIAAAQAKRQIDHNTNAYKLGATAK